MGRRAKDSTVEVSEGVYLKMMGDALHCYFRLGGKQFRRSTKTSDLREAKLLALTWHKNALLKMANGEEVDCVSFAKLKREYLKHIQTLPKHAYHSATIERHMLPYFARFDDVAKIKRADMVQYVAFRRGQHSALRQAISLDVTMSGIVSLVTCQQLHVPKRTTDG